MPDLVSATTLIDVIVACCSRSELKPLVGTDALRTVLQGAEMQRAMFPERGVMTLQPLYDLLTEQAGFEHAFSIVPLCRIKEWESVLGVKVELPTALAEMTPEERTEAADRSRLTSSELSAILVPPVPRSKSPTVPGGPPARNKPITRELGMAAWTERAGMSTRGKIAVAAAVLSVVAVGVSLYLTLRSTHKVDHLEAKAISSDIPLANVRRSGDVIVATISDPAWIAKPERERRAQLEAAADNVRTLGKKLVLMDSKAAPVGTLVVDQDAVVTFMPAF
jgi:hypothetical protein